jgi:copper chaperone CopZ
METRELQISGMSCGHCIAAVREALTQVPGVDVRDVEIGKAVVAFDGGTVTDGALVDAVDDAGYTATVVG